MSTSLPTSITLGNYSRNPRKRPVHAFLATGGVCCCASWVPIASPCLTALALRITGHRSPPLPMRLSGLASSMRLLSWRLSIAVGLVSRKAVEALLRKLRIGDRTALFAHTRLTERRVFLEQHVVVFTLHHVALRRPGW